MVKQISDNEIYLLIKYIKIVLWRVAKRLSCIEDARCLKVKSRIPILLDDFHFLVHRKLYDSVLSQCLPYPSLPSFAPADPTYTSPALLKPSSVTQTSVCPTLHVPNLMSTAHCLSVLPKNISKSETQCNTSSRVEF